MQGFGAACRVIYGLLLAAIGAAMALGGGKLAALGGSFYYLPAGVAALFAGVMVLRRRWRTAGWIWVGLMLVTLAWSLSEAGLNGWALMPRLLSPAILGLPLEYRALRSPHRADRVAGWSAVALAAILCVAVWLAATYKPVTAAPEGAIAAGASDGEWRDFGGTQMGRFHSSLAQITRANAGRLKQAWQYRLAPIPAIPLSQNQTVPIMAGGLVYACDAFSNVFALDAETGRLVWRHQARPDVAGLYTTKCRGVTYYAVPGASGECAARIYGAGTDGKLVALDARSGKVCAGFGVNGFVNLLEGIDQRNTGYYRVTSAPALVRGKLVIGGAVADGQYVGEPSGVIRAYDAVTGQLAWAWDAGNPGNRKGPPPGRRHTPDTPNSWGPMSADEALGLVYVPTGNATPDYWAGHRPTPSHIYGSAVVALDAETGQPRWHFQTAHYDVWDYDVASQPVLFELRRPGQPPVPALLQPTKRGELFVLDRRTGAPLYPVEERPAPQAGAVEKLSPSQPWSVAMPNLGGPALTEEAMWGISALDQLWCRITFRQTRYDGPFTPPGLTHSLADPGYTGGINWGSAAIDEQRQLAFLLSNRLVNRIRLVPRDAPEARGIKASSTTNLGGLVAQEGTPFAADIKPFMSPLGVPCQQPPHGLVNAVDLATGKLVWSRPIGTARDSGPMRMPSHLPFTIGTMTFGGTMSTAGGVVFAGGSQDHAFRAFDSRTGALLFEADLPGSAATRPMTYRSAKSGRQFVVVASDAGVRGGQAYGAITAFALGK